MLKVNILRTNKDSILPTQAHEGDAGFDIYSIDEVVIAPCESKLIHTGIRLELPNGTEAQVRPRSGLALKYQITVLNSPGTIDCNYRGEVGVILINHGKSDFHVKKGDRIAQLVIKPVLNISFEETVEVSSSGRGEGGFGSTGR
ncbi:dUTP diphosphatase [Halodesulfovibrio marinisediminis]|uniref:Deoxyuridine 5'-triphosphate nucleotidohydrolase n=1 Tax=Halodesulfovibrio marinisediminis DSM 17456 TaxID=1121457 RepID=A0A1N6IFM3_9BACT|nr:dUTP diphosphatase [Halodesulfovibrio marinisediminis]SIO30813.1 deoxyuridine 5'-triphosphate nucleotidohydrolase [Halodesulfovibrio marinisediminis DSM 17456]